VKVNLVHNIIGSVIGIVFFVLVTSVQNADHITKLREVYCHLQLIVVDGLTSDIHHTKPTAFSTEDLLLLNLLYRLTPVLPEFRARELC
jgi:hypothetical protein